MPLTQPKNQPTFENRLPLEIRPSGSQKNYAASPLKPICNRRLLKFQGKLVDFFLHLW